jgi:transcriptional regulator with XRE-family HTH domain
MHKTINEEVVLSERIKLLRKTLKLSQIEFGRRVNIGQDAISDYERGKVEPNQRTQEAIVREFSVNQTWWETGKGEILAKPTDQDKVRVYSAGDLDFYVNVPMVRKGAWASFVENLDDCTYEGIEDVYPIYVGDGIKLTDKHLVFEVLGSSMEPTINESAKVLAEQVSDGNSEFINEGVFIVVYANNMVIKRVKDNSLQLNGLLTLHSDNERSGSLIVRRKDIRCMWKVIRAYQDVK